ncbi:hypothetical protein BH20GEM2_BH20GEM2_09080 [soil metagenome]
MSDTEADPPRTSRGGFFSSLLGAPFSDDYVVGVLDTPAAAEATAEALRSDGFAADEVVVQTGSELAERMTSEDTTHRLRELTMEEGAICASYNERARHGALVSVYTRNDAEVERARTVLVEHGARELKHFGGWTVRELT